MAATYLGSFTIGGAIPLPNQVVADLSVALQGLRGACSLAIGRLGDIEAGLRAQVDALAAAKIAIRIPAISDIQLQLDACLAITAGLQIQVTDPTVYLNALLSGVAQVQANIAALVPPQIAIDGQLASQAALGASLAAKISEIDLQLALLVAISAALSALLEVVLSLSAALSLAISGVMAALLAGIELQSLMAAAGAHCFGVDCPLGSLGADLNAATPGAGIAAGAAVRAVLVLVEASNPGGVASLGAVFRVR